MTVKNALNWASTIIKKNSSSPALDAEVLLSLVLKKPKNFLFANPNQNLSKLALSKFQNLLDKRAAHCPVAYLTGKKEFFGYEFLVTPAVLIPRPETELLVELALSNLQSKNLNLKSVIDLGTGSGNIVIALAKNCRNRRIRFFATDISTQALRIARRNARRLGVSRKIRFMRGNLLDPILKSKFINHKSSLLVANLPYGWKSWTNNTNIESGALKFEPRQALYAQQKGLGLITSLLQQISQSPLLPATVLLEFDPRQKRPLQKIVKRLLPESQTIFHKDLAGRWRICEIIFKDF